MKRCGKCGKKKSQSEFSKDRQAEDGLQRYCKDCVQAYYRKKHPDVKCLTYNQTHRIVSGISQKFCTRCSTWKPISEFSKNRTIKGGLTRWCRGCRKKYRQAHKTERAEYQKEYCQTHKVKIAKRSKKYCQTHKIEIAEQREKYRKALNGYLCLIFNGMVGRCQNPKSGGYGARGIEVRCTFSEFYHHITVTLGYDTFDKLKGLDIDRINTNGHYEPGNIRVVTRSQNTMNSRKPSHYRGQPCSSQFKGVSWAKTKKKWQVEIKVDGKRHYLGRFINEITAAEAYDRASLKYHGEHGATNQSLGLFE